MTEVVDQLTSLVSNSKGGYMLIEEEMALQQSLHEPIPVVGISVEDTYLSET